MPGHRTTVFTLVKYAQLGGQASSSPSCGPRRAQFLRDSITQISYLTWFTHAYTVFKPHLGDCRLCGWLAHARSHGNIHGAGCSYRSSWRELCLRQKLSLVGCLADHVTATVSGHHALGLGHPGGRHSHLRGRKRELLLEHFVINIFRLMHEHTTWLSWGNEACELYKYLITKKHCIWIFRLVVINMSFMWADDWPMKFAFLLNPINYSTKLCNKPNYVSQYIPQKSHNISHKIFVMLPCIAATLHA